MHKNFIFQFPICLHIEWCTLFRSHYSKTLSLEKEDLLDRDLHHHECSTEDNLKAGHKSRPVKFFVFG